MSTPAEIETRVRAEWANGIPVSEGKASWIVTRDEFPDWYEAMIAERVAWATDAEAQATTDAAEQTRREQAKALYLKLKAGTATNREAQGVVAWLLRQEIKEIAP